jgi:hypothetical protein
VQLREENRQMKTRIEEHLDSCEEALGNNKSMVKRSLPLHRQVKNLYQQNKVLQAENRILKEELHQLKEEDAKRNLDVLAQVAVE